MIGQKWIFPLIILLITGCTSPTNDSSKQVEGHYKETQQIIQSISPQTREIKQQETNLQKIIGQVTILYLDVGQGDSIFIDYKDYEILIDAGDADHGKQICSSIDPYVDGKLELVVATHPHADHIGGFGDVLEKFSVARVIDSGTICDTKIYQNFLSKIKSYNILLENDTDQIIQISQGIQFRIYELSDDEKNINNNSVVTELLVGDKKFLFTGDMESDMEMRYLQAFDNVDILKVAHHGSSTASSYAFLEQCAPENAIISCGKDNRYRHPHEEILRRFNALKIHVYRTDVSGIVRVTCDGTSYKIITYS